MPSVRDILKGHEPSPEDVAPQQGLADTLAESAGGGLDTGDRSTAELIAERLRLAADQRAALAQGEIGRLQVRIDQLQGRLEDLAAQNLPHAEVKADLEEAHERLDEAKADLTRAHEARQNTDLASGRQAHLDHDEEFMHENKAAQSHTQGHGGPTGGPTVRSALGGKPDAKAAKMSGPARRKL